MSFFKSIGDASQIASGTFTNADLIFDITEGHFILPTFSCADVSSVTVDLKFISGTGVISGTVLWCHETVDGFSNGTTGIGVGGTSVYNQLYRVKYSLNAVSPTTPTGTSVTTIPASFAPTLGLSTAAFFSQGVAVVSPQRNAKIIIVINNATGTTPTVMYSLRTFRGLSDR